MSLLDAIISRVIAKINPEVVIATAISDDGSGDPIAIGKPSPLRADPTTGALLIAGSVSASETKSGTGPVPKDPKTVPTASAEAIVSVSAPVTKFVRVTSDFANTKTVYVSGTGVTVANGQPLGPGDVYTNSDVANANLIFCIAADADQILRIEVL